MALYDGFFDAEYNAETDQYDREYESGDFTGYLAQVIGSGVCVYNNENSFKVRMGDGAAIISPGYLFIQGYYLKNDADHSLTLPGTGTYAIAAHLSMGKRMIELEAVSVSSSYPDSLVLAIVNGTSNTADDTRYNTDICGVIDSAGELSKKIEYAINYIDNEIEGKLSSVQAQIDAKAAEMDLKIAQTQAIVDRIVPPPIGTIKFTAAQNVGEEWIRCDGSFINQSDYPDLVEALGKLTPGVESFSELLQATRSEKMSNLCTDGESVFVYLAESHKIVAVWGDDGKTEYTINNADRLVESGTSDIVMSMDGYDLYLAQNNVGESHFVLLESTEFGSSTTVNMNVLDIGEIEYDREYTMSFSNYIYPSVTKIGSKANIALKDRVYQGRQIVCAQWQPGSFSGTVTTSLAPYHSNVTTTDAYDTLPLSGFSEKNNKEMILSYHAMDNKKYKTELYSVTQGLYGDHKESPNFLVDSGEIGSIPKTTVPVGANDECILSVSISSKHPVIYYANYNTPSPIVKVTADAVSLPARARVFKDSVVYASAQGLWFVFVGTGLLFAEHAYGPWGYLDTQSGAGLITMYGSLIYDQTINSLYIGGMDSTGLPKIVRLKLPDIYNYANDGAFLPNLASDGVPAYIKATQEGGDTPGGDTTVTVKVLQPSSATALSFESLAQVQFNGVAMAKGEYTRTLGETFTVGIKRLGTAGTTSSCYAVVKVNGTGVASVPITKGATGDDTQTVTLYTADYASGITLQGATQYTN